MTGLVKTTRIQLSHCSYKNATLKMEFFSTPKALDGMRNNPLVEEMQIQGTMALCRLSFTALADFVLIEKGFERFVVPAMKIHKSRIMHASICQCLGNLAYQHKHVVKVWIYTSGVLREVLEHTVTMEDDDVLAHAGWLLRNLAESPAIRAGLIQAGAIQAIETILQATNSSIAYLHGCAALHQLWKDSAVVPYTARSSHPTLHSHEFKTSWSCIVSSMVSFPKSPGLQEECCGALSVMVFHHPDPIAVVKLLQDAKQEFPTRPTLQYYAATALSTIARRSAMVSAPSIVISQQDRTESPDPSLWFPFVPAA